MSNKSYVEKVIDTTQDRAQRASKVALAVLTNLKNDIWPRSDTPLERDRARKLQHILIPLGGAAMFAYIFSRKEELSTGVKEQLRSFKIGFIIGDDKKATEVGGTILAQRITDETGREDTVLLPEVDLSMLGEDELQKMENALYSHDELKGGSK